VGLDPLRVASVCTSALILGAAGLLDCRTAATRRHALGSETTRRSPPVRPQNPSRTRAQPSPTAPRAGSATGPPRELPSPAGSPGPARFPGPIWRGRGTGGRGSPTGALGPIGRAGGPRQRKIRELYNKVNYLGEIQRRAPKGHSVLRGSAGGGVRDCAKVRTARNSPKSDRNGSNRVGKAGHTEGIGPL